MEEELAEIIEKFLKKHGIKQTDLSEDLAEEVMEYLKSFSEDDLFAGVFDD